MRRGHHRRRSNSTRSIGRERALQHIEEARQLSQELGGTDRDVKEYFFSLPAHQLRVIVDAYEQRHGRAAREYAERTLPRWRSGRVKMGGEVASRLFSLLPPSMPLAGKYRLIENLWRHVGPSSRKTLRIGLDANVDDVLQVVRDHIQEVVVNYKIPDTLERRFGWLSAGDVQVKQDLLNHLREMEKSLVVEGARAQLPVMLNHLRGDDGRHTHRLAHILTIGKHELELVIDKGVTGVRLEEPAVPASPDGADLSWLWWVGIGLFVLYLFAR